ncbi:UNVERIFIED_CONTAM: hypothetical protein FKN15_051084 [Acipenser sinensis]
MGERCQYSDLEWWELQHKEEEKRRNLTIAVCMIILIVLLSVGACVTYCYSSMLSWNMAQEGMAKLSTWLVVTADGFDIPVPQKQNRFMKEDNTTSSN